MAGAGGEAVNDFGLCGNLIIIGAGILAVVMLVPGVQRWFSKWDKDGEE